MSDVPAAPLFTGSFMKQKKLLVHMYYFPVNPLSRDFLEWPSPCFHLLLLELSDT